MLILYLNINVFFLVDNIKTTCRNLPTTFGILEYVLMEITYLIRIVFINLPDSFRLYYFIESHSIPPASKVNLTGSTKLLLNSARLICVLYFKTVSLTWLKISSSEIKPRLYLCLFICTPVFMLMFSPASNKQVLHFKMQSSETFSPTPNVAKMPFSSAKVGIFWGNPQI